MRRATLAILLVVLLAGTLGAGVTATAPEATLQVSPVAWLPFIARNHQYGMVYGNLVCNPGAEYGEYCWVFNYPNSGNILEDCDNENCPYPAEGDNIFRYGGWHGRTDTGQSADFHLDRRFTYDLSALIQVWTTEGHLAPYDTLDVYLVQPNGHHLHLFYTSNQTMWIEMWKEYRITISPGQTGPHSLLFVAVTDQEKGDGGGLTNFFVDAIVLREWGDCKECVLCQLQDEPPIEVCTQGQGADCEGCCPDGDDCDGLDPQCPVTKPPLPPYRVVGREAECYDTIRMVLPIDDWVVDPRPVLREGP